MAEGASMGSSLRRVFAGLLMSFGVSMSLALTGSSLSRIVGMIFMVGFFAFGGLVSLGFLVVVTLVKFTFFTGLVLSVGRVVMASPLVSSLVRSVPTSECTMLLEVTTVVCVVVEVGVLLVLVLMVDVVEASRFVTLFVRLGRPVTRPSLSLRPLSVSSIVTSSLPMELVVPGAFAFVT